MDNHTLVTHEFTRKCLRIYTEDLSKMMIEKLEQDLPEYAETILHGGGYDLDKQIAALQAENTRLREALAPFARIARLLATFAPVLDPDVALWRKDSYKITVADCVAARRALGEASDG